MVSRCSYTSQYEFNVFENFFVIINKTKSKKVSSTHLAARRKMNKMENSAIDFVSGAIALRPRSHLMDVDFN